MGVGLRDLVGAQVGADFIDSAALGAGGEGDFFAKFNMAGFDDVGPWACLLAHGEPDLGFAVGVCIDDEVARSGQSVGFDGGALAGADGACAAHDVEVDGQVG